MKKKIDSSMILSNRLNIKSLIYGLILLLTLLIYSYFEMDKVVLKWILIVVLFYSIYLLFFGLKKVSFETDFIVFIFPIKTIKKKYSEIKMVKIQKITINSSVNYIRFSINCSSLSFSFEETENFELLLNKLLSNQVKVVINYNSSIYSYFSKEKLINLSTKYPDNFTVKYKEW
ncbi:MAG: hypothetical protein KA734_12690 [Fluviicola sp.]|nr:hypothetical protein [Fluviicola sp.]